MNTDNKALVLSVFMNVASDCTSCDTKIWQGDGECLWSLAA
jgi:hypothetical protein